jgi:hypothetical protein
VIITPCLQGSRPTWHPGMLLSSFTHPAQSTGPESKLALSQGCPIEDERSDCGKGSRRDGLSKDEADLIENAVRLPVSSANESILTQDNGRWGQAAIDGHGNGSEEARNASCRKSDDDRTTRPGIRVKRGT